MSVLGINDYIFVDGYRRVLNEFKSSRLPNLEAIFPVVELRLTQLTGVDGDLGRINFHVIFEEQFDPEVIEAQFINGLSSHYQLAHKALAWAGFATRENLAEFGRRIRETVPPDRKTEYQESDLLLGFNNLTVSLEDIQEALKHSSLIGHSLCAIGKTEWSELRWTDQSIATKKDLINGVPIVFTAADSPEAYERSRRKLTEQAVNDYLLDCSDAHHWMDSGQKDRIGNCFTWISAEPTLVGLRHAITEFPHRVFVGTLPDKLQAVRLHPSEYIKRVKIRGPSNTQPAQPVMFDCDLPVNPGFVAVIGNKGKGKSALLDTIGLACDCSTEAYFTFLSKERFRNPAANRAADHQVALEWTDGEEVVRGLNDHVRATAPSRVKYLPQRLMDQICSADPGEPSTAFAREIEDVLFAHVPLADRLGQVSLRRLVSARSTALEARINALRTRLSDVNPEIVGLERELMPERRARLVEQRSQLEHELEALRASEPPVPSVPSETLTSSTEAEANEWQSQIDDLDEEMARLAKEDAELALAIDAGNQLILDAATLRGQVSGFTAANSQRASLLGLAIEDLVIFEFAREAVETAVGNRVVRRGEIGRSLSPDVNDSIANRRQKVQGALQDVQVRFDEAARARSQADGTRRAWEAACEELEHGSAGKSGMDEVARQIGAVDAAPALLKEARGVRMRIALDILECLTAQVTIYEELYQPARSLIDRHPLAPQVGLSFKAALRERELEGRFFDIVSRGRVGTFMGAAEGAAELRRRLERAVPVDVEATTRLLTEVDEALHWDLRSEGRVPTDPEQCLRAGHTLVELYDLLYGLAYVEPYYSLQYRGTDLDGLSPGEKGTLLLMFYLLVDPRRVPLLLDQPDENLDNQTIKELLVPAIKQASSRRQVIAVTHNPNVAIVADADQIIVADRAGESFVYVSGAIEDGVINTGAVDVLEGTWPAFENRQDKYMPPGGWAQ
jgi:ABC-type lipoprotein export system ATPase subunit